jgi:tRNA A-37 threonylcarbamoyl transferase component Bud32
MSWVWIEPDDRDSLRRRGLASAGDFLRLQGVIYCGHPDRHVLRVDQPAAFLKKEHRVPWRDRLASAWAGFGLVSKSTREAKTLLRMARLDIPCPKVLAYGEEGGQAFLMLREEVGLVDVRHYCRQQPDQSLQAARRLGQCLARLHAAGYEHGDLYAKHVLIGPEPKLCLLDWQRCRRRWSRFGTWRCRDLATLDATLDQLLAGSRVRLACLRGYFGGGHRAEIKEWARRIRGLSLIYQRSPRIREMQQAPPALTSQRLLWLDGEALCVTPAFHEELGGDLPDWLRMAESDTPSCKIMRVPLQQGRSGQLERRSISGLGGLLHSWITKKPLPEVRKAALLFRLERHGVRSPRLLAFGRKRVGAATHQSFILSETPALEGTLKEQLLKAGSTRRRAVLLRQAGALLRRVHEAGYILGNGAENFAEGCAILKADAAALMVTQVDCLERRHRPWPNLAELDLPRIGKFGLSNSDQLRFYLGYVRRRRLTSPERILARKVLARQQCEVRR